MGSDRGVDMISNQRVIDSFLRKEINSSGHLMSDGKRLISYQTCIAQYTSLGDLLVNMTSYSVTTSKHRNMLLRSSHYYNIIKLDNIPGGAESLLEYYYPKD